MPAIPAILIDSEGTLHTLYNEELDLQELGRVENVHRATWIQHDPAAQMFTVIDASTGAEVYRNARRSECIAWEISNYQPGAAYYAGA